MSEIRRVDVFALTLHHAGDPYVISGGRTSTEQDATVVRVETSDGTVGWGEQAAFAPSFGTGYGPASRAAINLLAPALLGVDALRPDVGFDRMSRVLAGHLHAKSPLDIACWDLFGRTVQVRLSELLGGAQQEELRLHTGVGIDSPEVMAARCKSAVERGFRDVIIKVGGDWREDIRRIEACCDALGPIDTIIVDPNGYWSQADALRICGATRAPNVVFEQPCRSAQECATVRKVCGCLMILDESITSVGDLIHAFNAQALDGVRMKFSRLGGITPTRALRDVAVGLGLSVIIEDYGGADIVSTAALHVGCSTTPRYVLGAYPASAVVAERFEVGASWADDVVSRLPNGAGLGFEVDESMLGEPVMRFES